MSTYLPLASVCGATSAMVDVYDIDLNPHGVICCANCESIVLCRKAWDFMYSVPLYVNLSKVLELK